MLITPKFPKGWHKNAILLSVPVKFNFSQKKSATKFLCMITSYGKVVATSFPYPTVHRPIAGDVSVYLKLAFKVTHPFRKRRFPKLSFKSAIGLGAFRSCFSPYDTLAIHWHPRKILRRSSQENSSVGGFKRKGVVIYIAISDIWNARTLKRCYIGGKLALITNRNSYISFRLVPISVTLNDLERRSGPYITEFGNLRANCVKVVDKIITMDNLRIPWLVVNVCRGTARRPGINIL